MKHFPICAALVACLSTSACLEAEFSELDTSNGGLLGVLLSLAGSGALSNQSTTTYYAFTNTLEFFTSTGDGTWTKATASGATSSLRRVRHGGGQTLWALDEKANDNVVRSDDLGLTWSAVAVTGQDMRTLEVCGNTLFAVYDGGGNWENAYSNDGGTNWLTSTIQAAVGAFTPEDAACADENTLVAVKAPSEFVAFSTDGSATWTVGSGPTGSSPARAALRSNASDMLLAYNDGAARTNKSTNLGSIGTYGAADTATFATATCCGEVAATAESFYAAMIDGSNCNVYISSDGVSGTFVTRGTSCANTISISELVVGSGHVIYGGSDGGLAVPVLFRLDTATGDVVQDSLPSTPAANITGLVAIPN